MTSRHLLWAGLLVALIVGANLIRPPWQEPSESEAAKQASEAEEDWQTRPWTREELRRLEPEMQEMQVGPSSSFEAQRERARRAWEDRDGYMTTINEPGDMPTRNLWKTADRRDDGTPGIAPLVRTRLEAGQRILVYDGPAAPDGVEMWKVTDGDTFGWISALQLDSVPEGEL